MTHRPAMRRLLVSSGIVLALVAAVVTVRAAASWTESNAPLTVAPVAVASVQAALDQERARSAALEEQLHGLETATADLTTALEAARSQLGTDQDTADELRANLAAAQERLAELEAALEEAQAASTTRTVTTTSTSTTSHEDDEHDDD